MEMTDVDARDRAPGRTAAPSRLRVRRLALATGIAGVVAQLLARLGGAGGGLHEAPLGVVIGQALWNAAQVGLLILLVCLWQAARRRWVIALAVATAACLPFAIYAIGPGAWGLAVIMLVTCGLAAARGVPDLAVALVDAPARGTPPLAKFELLAFVSTLFCSMYNFNASKGVFPYWASLFERAGAAIGFTPDLTAIAHGLYTLGIGGIERPAFIEVGHAASSLGALAFALIWTVLPFLYVVYFAACAQLAKESPGARLQQALCLFGIVHFLFLTDLVDYRFGRGVVNPADEWAHWAERWAWRIAILLPVYQKLSTGHWRRGNGRAGVVLHYLVAAWAAGFLVYQLLIYDIARFAHFVIGEPEPQLRLFGVGYKERLGYHGALLVMTLVYGFAFVALRCKRIVFAIAPPANPPAGGPGVSGPSP